MRNRRHRALMEVLPVTRRLKPGEESEFYHRPFFAGGMLGLQAIESRVNEQIEAAREHFYAIDLSRVLIGVSITPSHTPTPEAVLESNVLLVDLQYWTSREEFASSYCFDWLTDELPGLCRPTEGPDQIIEICEDASMRGLVRDYLVGKHLPVTFFEFGSDDELVNHLATYADALSSIPRSIAKGLHDAPH